MHMQPPGCGSLNKRRGDNTMPLLPRWRYMTPKAQRSARRLGISAGVLVLGLILNVPLLWLLIGLAAWWLWSGLQRRR